MKPRKIILTLCLLAFVLGLSACGSYRYSQNCVSDLDGVSMYTEKATYAPDDHVINVVWKNKTSLALTFGEMFTLEKKTDSGWEALEGRPGFAFPMEGIMLPPHREVKHSYYLQTYTESLETGTYRILISFYDDASPANTPYSLSVEFNVA